MERLRLLSPSGAAATARLASSMQKTRSKNISAAARHQEGANGASISQLEKIVGVKHYFSMSFWYHAKRFQEAPDLLEAHFVT